MVSCLNDRQTSDNFYKVSRQASLLIWEHTKFHQITTHFHNNFLQCLMNICMHPASQVTVTITNKVCLTDTEIAKKNSLLVSSLWQALTVHDTTAMHSAPVSFEWQPQTVPLWLTSIIWMTATDSAPMTHQYHLNDSHRQCPYDSPISSEWQPCTMTSAVQCQTSIE